MLADDRFLVYQHNELRQTPLHVAAKRNHLDIAVLLIRYHSDVNAKDSMGKTPLYFSVLDCYKDMTILLIANMSSCFTSDAQGNNLQSITTDPMIKIVVQKGKEVSIHCTV